MTERIVQRGKFDCGAAALAMATGRSIDEIERRLGHLCSDEIPGSYNDGVVTAFGTTDDEVMRLLWELGIPATYFATRETHELFGVPLARLAAPRRFLFGSQQLKDTVLPGRRAVLAVPSLNRDGAGHCIYWTGERVLDPSPSRFYGDLAGVPIYSAVVILA